MKQVKKKAFEPQATVRTAFHASFQGLLELPYDGAVGTCYIQFRIQFHMSYDNTNYARSAVTKTALLHCSPCIIYSL